MNGPGGECFVPAARRLETETFTQGSLIDP